jgi:hypothetical protein
MSFNNTTNCNNNNNNNILEQKNDLSIVNTKTKTKTKTKHNKANNQNSHKNNDNNTACNNKQPKTKQPKSRKVFNTVANDAPTIVNPNPNSLFGSFRRWGHTITSIPNHNNNNTNNCTAIAFGGYGSSYSGNKNAPDGRLNSIEIFDYDKLLWYTPDNITGQLPKEREHHTAHYILVNQVPYLLIYGGRSNPHHGFNDIHLLNLTNYNWKMVEPQFHENLDIDTINIMKLGRWRHTSIILSKHNHLIVYGGRYYNKYNASYELCDTILTLNLNDSIEQWKWNCVYANKLSNLNDSSNPYLRFSHQMVNIDDLNGINDNNNDNIGNLLIFGGFVTTADLFDNPKNNNFYSLTIENTATNFQLKIAFDCAQQIQDYRCECNENVNTSGYNCNCRPVALFSFQMHTFQLNNNNHLIVIGGGSDNNRESFNRIYHCNLTNKIWTKPNLVATQYNNNSTSNNTSFNSLLSSSMYMKCGSCILSSSNDNIAILIAGGGGNVFHFNPYFNTTQIFSIHKHHQNSFSLTINIQSIIEHAQNAHIRDIT